VLLISYGLFVSEEKGVYGSVGFSGHTPVR